LDDICIFSPLSRESLIEILSHQVRARVMVGVRGLGGLGLGGRRARVKVIILIA